MRYFSALSFYTFEISKTVLDTARNYLEELPFVLPLNPKSCTSSILLKNLMKYFNWPFHLLPSIERFFMLIHSVYSLLSYTYFLRRNSDPLNHIDQVTKITMNYGSELSFVHAKQ